MDLCTYKSKPLEGANTGGTSVMATKGLTMHHYYRQALKAVAFFCLLILATRKRGCKFFEAQLIVCVIFFRLIADVFCYFNFIFCYCIHKISFVPKVS